MLMKKECTLNREYQSESEWLKEIFKKSNSQGSKNRVETSLRIFDMWCKEKLEIPDPEVSDLKIEYRKNRKCTEGKEKW